ncbi:MAG TPA: hypothetical protein VI248_05035, partial [Kineosporiaceae bacterium]
MTEARARMRADVLRYRRRAEAVQEALRTFGADVPGDPDAVTAESHLTQVGRDLVRQATDPVRIAAVGEYNVGKTMLLGTLLGRPDLLPVESRAATGNVTALYLRPGERGSGTRLLENAEIDFLSEQELARCVEHIMRALLHEVRQLSIPDELSPLLERNPVTHGWGPLEKWCRAWAFPPQGGGNLELRKISDELLAIRDAQLSAPTVLGRQAVVPVDRIRAALDLGEPHAVPDRYPERRGGPEITVAGIASSGPSADRDPLAVTFPLVRRVSHTVVVDPEHWSPEASEADGGFVLLDFPGLTAMRSARRDEFLSRDELDTVHAILTVYGRTTGNNIPHSFYTMLESAGRGPAELRDSILVAGNVFDAMPLPDLPGDRPLTLEQLRAASPAFSELSHSAGALLQHRVDRLRFTSALIAIDHYRMPAQFGDHERNLLDQARAGVPERAKGWGDIGARLLAGDLDSPWGRNLCEFARDGGIDSLRTLVQDHAREHGLANKANGLRRAAVQLTRATEDLVARLPEDELSDDEVTRERQHIERVVTALAAHHTALTESLDELVNPERVHADGTPVVESARARVTR